MPHRSDHPIYFRPVKFYLNQPFRSSTVRKLDGRSIIVNAAFRCKRPRRLRFSRHIQFVDGASVAGHQNCNNPVLHKNLHSLQIGGSMCYRFTAHFSTSFSTTSFRAEMFKAQIQDSKQLRHLLDLSRRAAAFSSRPPPPAMSPCSERFPRCR